MALASGISARDLGVNLVVNGRDTPREYINRTTMVNSKKIIVEMIRNKEKPMNMLTLKAMVICFSYPLHVTSMT